MDLKLSLSGLPGIGPFYARRLERLEIKTVEDLINHFPFRYDDYSTIKPADETQIGEVVTLTGEIWSIKNIYTRFGKVLTQAIFNDGSSPIMLTWFNQGYLTKSIQTGDKLQISGKLTKYKSKLSIMVPSWEKVIPTPRVESTAPAGSAIHTGRLVPVYPETFGVSSKYLRSKIHNFLPLVLPSIKDYLPDDIKENMLPLTEAIQKIHFPENLDQINEARQRLSFDELFLIQLATHKARLKWEEKPIIKPWKINNQDLQKFLNNLPFKLTPAQEKALKEIALDLQKTYPMNRLLQGEVGSGKTVVAAIAIYLSSLNEFNCLLMAPTEILAWQHYETVSKLLEPFGILVGIYTGSRKKVHPSVILSEAKNLSLDPSVTTFPHDDKMAGPASVIIGTHALLSDKLSIPNIGLVIIDEQHRFGVNQRTNLRKKGLSAGRRNPSPHFLTMTATPIPRTVALTLYGDLDISIIDELPKGRQIVRTHLVPERKRGDAYKFISDHISQGEQAYIITPLIDESETLVSVRAAKKEFESLKNIFPKFNLGLLHGRMRAKEKESVIEQFRNNKIQILVSTSVVEVGMDIPNATIMIIEGAERYGLAQLHQLRGRVGRGAKQSFCLAFTTNDKQNYTRLKYLETTFDGLKLAELDLKIRGSGTIFATAQHGPWNLKIANLSDLGLIEKTKKAAEGLLKKNPELDKYPKLQAQLQKISVEVMPD